jgi:hypothetical protein
MKKSKTTEYLKETFENFKDSFRNLDKTILYVVVYNMVFYLASYAVYTKMLSKFMEKAQPVFDIATENVYGASEAVIESQVHIIRSFRFAFWSYGIGFIIAIFLLYALVSLLVWGAITKKKLKPSKFELNFFLLNLIWIVGAGIIIYLMASSFKLESLALGLLALMLIYAHLTTILYIAYFKKKKIRKSIKSAFNTGIAKIHHFIVPYVFALAVFIVLNIIIRPIGAAAQAYMNIIFFIAFLFYFAWLRIYIYSFAKKLA